MDSPNSIVFPGDFLGISEEFVSGPGTYEENGKIYSLFFGSAVRDERKRSVAVSPRKLVRPLRVGDLVHGTVVQLYDSMVMVKFSSQPIGNEFPANGETAFIRISEIMHGYVERLRDVIRTGDTVRARVVQISPLATYLTIKDRDLGVVGASCSRCRSKTDYDGRSFVCRNCGWREGRKTVSGNSGG